MSNTTIIHNSDQAKLFADVARLFASAVRASTEARIVCALPGGRSIVGVLHALSAEAGLLEEPMWKKLDFFMIDERMVPLESPDSNFKLLHENLFGKLMELNLIRSEQLHPFILEPSTADRGLARYENELHKVGGRFHISFLGVGEDAHVAALFPNKSETAERGQKFLAFDDSPKPPPHRMTASRDRIVESDVAFALFVGEGKREAFQKYRAAGGTEMECPAKLLDAVKQAYAVTDLLEGPTK
ncbi:MAG: 6-phosphogluconolactonase [Deltaproteobacteria bacterium]|nr:6-phosphogluconolactonase [Deltaproteobacteria bacterium]